MAKTHKLVYISLLVTLGTALHIMEAMLPNPFPIPGAKLGLANIVTLITLYLYGFKEGLGVAFLRVLFGSLLSGTIFSLSFMLSLSGALVSTLVMAVLIGFIPAFSIIGVSVAGSLAHNLGQLMTASILIQAAGIFYYLPFLLFFSLPTGFSTGLITRMLLKYLPRESRP